MQAASPGRKKRWRGLALALTLWLAAPFAAGAPEAPEADRAGTLWKFDTGG